MEVTNVKVFSKFNFDSSEVKQPACLRKIGVRNGSNNKKSSSTASSVN
jgi:hypothetical protein